MKVDRSEMWDIGKREDKQFLLNSVPNVHSFLVNLHLKDRKHLEDLPCIAGSDYVPKDGSEHCDQCIFSGEIRGLSDSEKGVSKRKVLEHYIICLISRKDADKKYNSDVEKSIRVNISEAIKANW